MADELPSRGTAPGLDVMPNDPASAEPPRAETLEELFAALESPLLAYALRLLGRRSVAEDVVQDGFMKLHAQFAEVREPRHWLYRTVHNAAANHRRRDGRLESFDPVVAPGKPLSVAATTPDAEPLPDEQIARIEHIGLVRLSLQTLDARSRELLRLKFDEDLSYKQIAEQTGLKVGHVGYLLHHAIKEVAEKLQQSGVTP